MINAERLQAVMTQILDHPELHKQNSWTCGTTACFAGWSTWMYGAQDGWTNHGRASANGAGTEIWQRDDDVLGTADLAQELLGLTEIQALYLFDGGNTIPELELMVKDLVSGNPLLTPEEYTDEVESK